MPLPLMPWGAAADTPPQLVRHAVAVPALASQIAPQLVLDHVDSTRLRAAVARHDVRRGGQFAATPSAVQWWDRPWTQPDGPGLARLLGAVDIVVDRPMRGQSSMPRVVVTELGRDAGLKPVDVLRAVLSLADIDLEPERVGRADPPRPDPFRTRHPGLTAR